MSEIITRLEFYNITNAFQHRSNNTTYICVISQTDNYCLNIRRQSIHRRLVLLKMCYRYSTFYTVKIKRPQGHFKCRLYK